MKKRLWLLAGVLALAAPLLRAHPGHEADKSDFTENEAEFTDEFIAKKKAALDDESAKRVARLKAEFQTRQKLEEDVLARRIAFEKKTLAAQKAFLGSLAGKTAEQRRGLVKEFHGRQQDARAEFLSGLRDLRETYMKEYRKP